MSGLVDEDVAGLEVAVDDAVLVCVLDGFADFDEEPEALACAEVFVGAVCRDGVPADVLHCEEGLGACAGVGGSGLVDLGDPGVLEPAEDVGLVLESAQHPRREKCWADDLESDGSAGVGLGGAIDDAHAAFAEGVFDDVRAKRACAGRRGRKASRAARFTGAGRWSTGHGGKALFEEHGFDGFAEGGAGPAFSVEEVAAGFGLDGEGLAEEGRDLFVLSRGHVKTPRRGARLLMRGRGSFAGAEFGRRGRVQCAPHAVRSEQLGSR